MTRKEAKRELRPIKEMESDIRAVELEIERLMTVATKMTPNYNPIGSASGNNKLEEAVIKIDEYKSRLTNLIMESLVRKNECLNKVAKIEPASLRKILLLYYFHNLTLEKTAEIIGKSPRWTYEMYLTALDEYCKIS
jgi:hypothetical protein